MFVTKDEVLQSTLMEVQAIDAKLERLEFELNMQVGRV